MVSRDDDARATPPGSIAAGAHRLGAGRAARGDGRAGAARGRASACSARADVAGGRPAADEHAVEPAGNLAGRLAGARPSTTLFTHVQAVATEVRGVYLVGGAVRDLLLGESSFDIDLAVEGDGIAFARTLARTAEGARAAAREVRHRRGRRERPHATGRRARASTSPRRARSRTTTRRRCPRSSTPTSAATWRGGTSPSTRWPSRSSPSPSAPCSTSSAAVGDLEARRIVVLHNLSFIEDPTRILRAVRYESRYGLRMDAAHPQPGARLQRHGPDRRPLLGAPARRAGRCSSTRRRSISRCGGSRSSALSASIHARLAAGAEERALIRRADELRAVHRLEGEVPAWRLRLVWLLRRLSPEEIAAWARRMRIKRRDAAVLERSLVVAQRLVERVSRGPDGGRARRGGARRSRSRPCSPPWLSTTPASSADRLGRYLDVEPARAPRDRRRATCWRWASARRRAWARCCATCCASSSTACSPGRDQELAAAARLQEDEAPRG